MKWKLWVLLGIIYITFIALGLPDALIGSGWNLIRVDFNYPLGALGAYTFSMYVANILATSNTPKILRRFSTHQTVLMALSAMTLSLLLMSRAPSYVVLILFALPLGFGAGMIDMSVNHFLAAHYKAHHMNFLHAFYGFGVTIGPGIMALTLRDENWRGAFLIVGLILTGITMLVLFSAKFWTKEAPQARLDAHQTLSLRALKQTPGVLNSTVIFALLVHVESLGGVWIATYIFLTRGVTYAEAALFTTIFFTAFTIARFVIALLSLKIKPQRLIMIGQSAILLSALLMILPLEWTFIYIIAVALYGLGCAPMFPNMMVLSGRYFKGRHLSKIVSMQMTLGYLGFGILTPLAGVMFQLISIHILPYLMLFYAIVLLLLTMRFVRQMETTNRLKP